jgi:putative DNA primase/helicase
VSERQPSIDLDDLRRALTSRADSLAVALFGEPNRPLSSPRNLRFGNHGSLSVELARNRGLWRCHESGAGGGPLDMVMFGHRCGLAAAIEWANAWVGGAAVTQPEHRPATAPKEVPDATIKLALKLWAEAMPARGTAAEAYLATRQCSLPTGDVLRFHPACPRRDGDTIERLPAMLALMTDALTNEPVGVHRTFLLRDGSGKAGGKAKMMLGGAGVIRLSPDENVTDSLGICEGIETGLALTQRAGWSPVWAAGSAGMIAKFPVMPVALTIFADMDETNERGADRWQPAGLNAANQCAFRWREVGGSVRIACPPAGSDWHTASIRCAA